MEEIVLIGDSLTFNGANYEYSGWAARLMFKHLGRRDVLNRGIMNYNSRWTREIIGEIIKSTHRPVLYIINLGDYDAAIDSPESVSVAEYIRNLKYILNQVNKQSILITPSPLIKEVVNYSVNNSELYKDACIKVALDYNTTYINTWQLLDPSDFISVGKLNENGNSKLFQAVDGMVDRILEPAQLNFQATKQLDTTQNDLTVYIVLGIILIVGSVLGFVMTNRTRLRSRASK